MVSQVDRKSTQRERLLKGMMEVAVQEGYAAATVARVIAHAGVSRPTFYDYFDDRQACFLAVHRELAAGLVDQVRAAVDADEPARSVHAAVAALVEFACAEPVAARFVMHEPTTAGGEALNERDHTIAAISRLVEHARARARADAPTPDVFVPTLIGSVYIMLSLRLRRGERDLASLTGELDRWLTAYERPTREHHRRPLEGPLPATSPFVSTTSLYPPQPLPSGRAGLSSEEVGYNHRERILFACVEMSNEKGYAMTTIADIAAVAHVDRRVFYKHFHDKEDAFQATLEYGFQRSIAVTATAFFSAPTWPERVWQAGQAFTQFLATNHSLAEFAFIHAYTIGPTAVHRFEDLRAAYTIFLQEGRQQPRKDVVPVPSDTVPEAIATTVFETAYHEIRRGRTSRLGRTLPQIAHLCLTPFLGTAETDEFIDSKLAQNAAAA